MTSPRLPRPERILILKPSSLGDVITAVPVLAGLRRTFPAAHIAWLATPTCAPILAGQTDLDETILFDRRRFSRIGRSAGATGNFITFCRNLRRLRFDWVIDLQGLFRSGFLARVTGAAVRAGFADAREFAKTFYTDPIRVDAVHTVDRNIDLARALGVDARADDLVLTVTDEAKAFVESFLNEHNLAGGGYLVIAPGTRWRNKLYPPRHWRKVIAELSRDIPIVLTGADADRELCADLVVCNRQTDGWHGQVEDLAVESSDASSTANLPLRSGLTAPPALEITVDGKVFDLAGRTTLPQAVALIASAGAVVCCDSAANFIAPAVGTPFVTLIGPTRPERTGPYGPLGEAIVADVPCQGCLKRSCRHVTCMQLIEPEQVAAAARKAMANTPEWSGPTAVESDPNDC